MTRSRRRFDRSIRSTGPSRARSVVDRHATDTAEAVALLDAGSFGTHELAEIEDFLEGDGPMRDSDADFRERLRRDLWWDLLVRRAGVRGRLPTA